MTNPGQNPLGEGTSAAAFLFLHGSPEGDAHANPTIDIMIGTSLREAPGAQDRLINAYLSANNNAMHATGLAGFDAQALHSLNVARATSAAKFATSFRFMAAPEQQMGEDATARTLLRTQKIITQGIDPDIPEIAAWLTEIRGTGERGLLENPVALGLLRLDRISYAPELGLDYHYSPHENDREWAVSAFGEAELDSGISISDVIVRLREEGRADASLERFDARHRNMRAVMQVEASTTFLRDLRDLWLLGGDSREVALTLFTKYRSGLLWDNYKAKQAMYAHLLTEVDQLVARGGQGSRQEFLEIFSARIHRFVSDCKDTEDMFISIREQLVRKAEVNEAAGAAVVKGEVVAEPDPKVVAGFQARAADLAARDENARQRFRMTRTAINKAGFGRAIGLLTHPDGLYRKDQYIQRAMDKDAAAELVVTLRELSTMSEIGLAVTLMNEFALVADVNMLREEVRTDAPRADIALPSVFRFSRQLAEYRKNWAHYEQVILAIWPTNARQAADKIHDLLFPPASN